MSKNDADFAASLKRLAAGGRLTAEEAADAFGAMMAGAVSEIRMASFLTALQVRLWKRSKSSKHKSEELLASSYSFVLHSCAVQP